MVKIEEIHEGSDDGFVTESDSGSISSAASDADSLDLNNDLSLQPYSLDDETFADRIYALRDIVPPSTRMSIAEKVGSVFGTIKTGGSWVGSAAWVITTSLLLVGLPIALSVEGETMLVAQEKEMERQQQGQQGLTGPQVGGQPGQTSVTPPGF